MEQIEERGAAEPPDAREIMEDFGTSDPKTVRSISAALKRHRDSHEALEKKLHEERLALRNVNAVMQSELNSARAYIAGLEEQVERAASVFTAEDIELIKAHVRHPGALEAAKLKERIAAALTIIGLGGDVTQTDRLNVVQAILSAP